jgi:DNA recombination protein RmuC
MNVLMLLLALVCLAVAVAALVWATRSARSAASSIDEEALAQRMAAEVRAQVGEAAVDALAANNEQFLALATERLGAEREKTKNLLDPFAAQMKLLDATVAKLRTAHEQEKGAVEKMTGEMVRQISELTTTTSTLSEALRSPTARGAWGENQLRNVIELAGMVPYCDYEEQATGENREGAGGRPDVRVRMPNGAHLAVDAKVPLSAYLDAQAATDAVDVDRHMARHAAALRAHVNALASKKYWEQNEGPAPEFVVLFVPGESFLADALRSDVSLLQDAMEKRVLLASPVNLLALLWSVARGWQEARIAENARLIADLGEDLYSRMGKVLEHLGKTGRGLDQAVRSYNDLIGSVEGRLLVTLRRFPELGVGTDPLESPSELESLPRSPQVPEVPDTEA